MDRRVLVFCIKVSGIEYNKKGIKERINGDIVLE